MTYRAPHKIDWLGGMNVSISLAILQFDKVSEKQTCRIDFSNGSSAFGAITWIDRRHYSVRSSIAHNFIVSRMVILYNSTVVRTGLNQSHSVILT